MRRRALRDATLRQIASAAGFSPTRQLFASLPTQVEQYEVIAVLTVDRDELNRIPTLTTSEYELHEARRIPIPCSIVEAAIDELLSAFGQELSKPEPGANLLASSIPMKHLLESAAARMTNGLAMRCDTFGNTQCSEQSLFSNLIEIAGLGY